MSKLINALNLGGFGWLVYFNCLLTAGFETCKLFGVIHWSIWWIISPLWLTPITVVILVVLAEVAGKFENSKGRM